LLADGRQLVRAGWRRLLERESDIKVAAEAASGREAVALAREIRPDVVLMNIRLPGLDGVETTRRIIAHPEVSEVEVLLLSEDEREEDLFAALRAGASGFLTMDTDPAELLRAVRVLAGGSSSALRPRRLTSAGRWPSFRYATGPSSSRSPTRLGSLSHRDGARGLPGQPRSGQRASPIQGDSAGLLPMERICESC
jgi:DNA-binding NarL/FixJ family response regulator